MCRCRTTWSTDLYPGPLTPLKNPPRWPVKATVPTATISIGKRYSGKFCLRPVAVLGSAATTPARSGWWKQLPAPGAAAESLSAAVLPVAIARPEDQSLSPAHSKSPRPADCSKPRRPGAVLRPLRDEVKHHAGQKQCDRKVDQHHVLRVFGEKRRLDVKRMHVRRLSLDHNLRRHLGMNDRRSSYRCPVW